MFTTISPRPPKLVGTVLFGIAVVVLTGCANDSAALQISVAHEYHRFGHEPEERDVPDLLPAESALDGLDQHYFRHIGVKQDTQFYLARTNHDETTQQGLCFFAINHESQQSVSTCVTPDEIQVLDDLILGLDVSGMGLPAEAFLVPDTVELELPAGWSQHRQNLVLVTEPERASSTAQGRFMYSPGLDSFTLDRDAVETSNDASHNF